MDAKTLADTAKALFAQHGLVGWTFALTTAKRRLGVCKYRPKRIEISEYYARHNTDASVLDTILHEIAHALAGAAAKHGPAWQAVAARIGATPRACDDSPDTVVEPGDWRTTCPGCNKTHHRYKRPRALNGYRCKCPARSPLVFAFAGDPAREPPPAPVPASWYANCTGCGTVHRRARRPKAGVWRCRCSARSELEWAFEPGESVRPAPG